jgi:four helix bundle protein
MATVFRFEDLEVWKLARLIAKRIFQITSDRSFPRDYGYIHQINDAAGSIMDNIAEGFERGSRLEFVNHLSFSKGSAGEVRSQLYRGFDKRYYDEKTFEELLEMLKSESGKLSNLITYLNERSTKGLKFKNRT